MINVFYVLNSGMIGGGNRAMLGLFDKLDRTVFRPIAIVPETGPMLSELCERDVVVHTANVLDISSAGRKLEQIQLILKLRQWMKRYHPRILHANDPLTYRLPSISTLGLGIRRICHFQLPPARSTLSWAFRVRPHGVITCSAAMEREYCNVVRRLAPKARLAASVNYANIDRFTPAVPPPDLRRDLRIPSDAQVVSIVGLVSERKGHPQFLEMASRLLQRTPKRQLCFLIVGEDILDGGRYRRQMQDYARELGIQDSVRFLGFRDDVRDILRLTDVVVLPSRKEGLPLAIVEAMACGVAVVGYDIPGVAEVIADGVTGSLVPPGNVTELSNAVHHLLDNESLRRTMGVASRNRAERMFSVDSHVSGVLEMYKEVLQQR